MIITASTNRLNFSARIIEPKVNNEASNYISVNYNKLLGYARSKDGISSETALDLISDVFESILKAEKEGRGFDMQYGLNKENGNDNLMDVEQFVYSRIDKYALNRKYNKNISESYSNSKGSVTVVSASFDEGDGEMSQDTEFQAAYRHASTEDSTSSIEDEESLREEIEYCINICHNSKYKFNIMNLFKHISFFEGADSRVFKEIIELKNENKDFAEALYSVLSFSTKYSARFNELIMQM